MEPIAIIGIGCSFPNAKNPQEFWKLLKEGKDVITKVPSERWDVDAIYEQEPATRAKTNSPWGSFLEGVDLFDANFFGISPRETQHIDPQQRLLLEVTWKALENAGIAPESLAGSQTGVFIGISNADYHRLVYKDLSHIEAYSATGTVPSTASNRLSYVLNLRGPSIAVDTACSSSLVAVHSAIHSLQSRESNLCLVGGVNLILSPDGHITFSQARMLAPDGRCKTFDASADGYVRGEGCGIVVLKGLEDALRDGDNIQAVIKGSAVNQDGLTNGLTAPNGPSQQAVVRQALERAGVKPADISYVEAHGTGTSLGDPIEMNSLKRVLMPGRDANQPCWIGSVKTNIGHLEAAAGIAGLIKVVLSLQNQEIPPHLNFKKLNPLIKIKKTPIEIPTTLQKWSTDEKPRLAGVSSFGFGGTNAHVILESAPQEVKSKRSKQTAPSVRKSEDVCERPRHIFTLSAKCEQALQELGRNYEEFLSNNSIATIDDICFSANTGRSHFNHRLAIIASDKQDLANKLAIYGKQEEVANEIFSGKCSATGEPPLIAFLFTGQGSQYVNMGRQLYETQPVFREALEECEQILKVYLQESILDVLYPESAATSPINETAYTQPALFAIEYALAQLWQSWGIKPDVVMGHSVGEYVAATIAGVFSLNSGLKLISHRGRLMQQLPPVGKMLSIMASEDEVNKLIASYSEKVAIAAINGPQSIVISGEAEAIDSVKEKLDLLCIKNKQLQVSHAFHSHLMEPMLEEFEVVANQVTYNQPRITLISNVTGEKADDSITTANYWVNHIRQPVNFADSMEALKQEECEVFIEIGAKPILLGMGRQCLPEDDGVWIPSLRAGQEDWQQMLQSLALLYVRGVEVNWLGFDKDYSRSKVILPNYPFQKQRYWIETPDSENQVESKITSIFELIKDADIQELAKKLEQLGKLSPEQANILPETLNLLLKEHHSQLNVENIKNWLYQIEWKALSLSKTGSLNTENQPPSHWLIFADSTDIGKILAENLHQQGHQCTLVYPGDVYRILEAGIYCINPCQPEDFKLLLKEIIKNSQLPLKRIVHLWSLDAVSSQNLQICALQQSQELGCASVLHLLQTLLKQDLSTLPQLWLITRGSQAVKSDTESVTVAQAPIWGLGKVIALEHPQLWGGMVDLDPSVPTSEVEMLVRQIQHTQENHVAFREGQTYVPRLQKQILTKSQVVEFDNHSTYLITGGLGALGLHVAEWLVSKGAKNLVLTGRREPSSKAQEVIKKLEHQGTQVLLCKADVSQSEDVAQMLEVIQSFLPPLKGIIHAAGVLDDGLLQDMSPESLKKVMAPKVEGTWNLHTLTQSYSLDFFVCFSSMASLLGSPGQGNYAAANAFMDSLVYHRRTKGLPGLSINWGPWSQAGMASRLDNQHLSKMQAMGITPLTSEQGLLILEQLLEQSLSQVGVLPLEWSVFQEQFNFGNQIPFLDELVTPSKPTKNHNQQRLLDKLASASEGDRHNILIDYIQTEVKKVLRLNSSESLDLDVGFAELGMDSLMVMELKNQLQNNLETSVPTTLAIEYPTIQKLSDYLAEEVMGWKSTEVNNIDSPKIEIEVFSELEELEQIAEEDVESLIAKELEELQTLLGKN